MFPRWANLLLPLLVVGFLGAVDVRADRSSTSASRPKATDVGYSPAATGPVFARAARRQARLRLPLLPHDGSRGRLRCDPLGADVHELPQLHSSVQDSDGGSDTRTSSHSGTRGTRPGVTAATTYGTNHYSSPTVDKPRIEGTPIQWVKVHDLPDYAYFNHSAHTNKGIGCVSCHGRIDHMEQSSTRIKPLNMGVVSRTVTASPRSSCGPSTRLTNLGWTVDQIDDTNKADLAHRDPRRTTSLGGGR